METSEYFSDAVALLQHLIHIPSVSREEKEAADFMEVTIRNYGFRPHRVGNNIWTSTADAADHPFWSADKPTVLLNAHIDTVKAVSSWTRDPFTSTIEDDQLFGLGSNDCGGGLVTLLQTLRRFHAAGPDASPYNLVYLASSEEEVSGKNGIVIALPEIEAAVAKLSGKEKGNAIDVAIVGEPTGLKPAVAEKGLMVLDLIAHGKSGHAARNEGVNAIYEMLDDLIWIRDYKFKKESDFLGPTKMTATVIHAGTQHNVIPDLCTALIDVRTNELYTNEEVFDIINKHTRSELHAHSFRLHSSHIRLDHPLIKRCSEMGLTLFGSPTLSDQALMPFPSFKLGPGESSRSHSANEFICLSEIRKALEIYFYLLS